MKTVDFEKVKAGDLVEVPRTQFAPMRRGWNGWLFSEAVVIQKGISPKSKRKVIKVEMRTPKSSNDYGTMEKTFYAKYVFQTQHIETARRFMQSDGVNSKEEFYEYIKQDDVCGCDWIKFQEKFCAGCSAESCDNCPNGKYRNNPDWWLKLQTGKQS